MYRNIMVASFVGLVVLAMASAGIALWGTSEARYQFRRVQLASAVLENQLSLTATANEMVRVLHDDISHAVGEGAAAEDVARIRAAVQAQIDAIRRGIAAEVGFVRQREDESGELEDLARIERLLHQLMTQYDQALRLVALGQRAEATALFHHAVETLAGPRMRALFTEAVAEEQREVAEAYEDAEEALSRVSLAGKIGGSAAILLAGVSLSILLGRLRRPLDELVEAANDVAAGDLSRRVRLEPGRRDEFADVAASFNGMVEEVARSRAAEAAARHSLEEAVAARTEELARANATLQQADAVRRRFLADVSHELRTPLTVMRGEAEVALRGTVPRTAEEYRAALGRVAEQAVHSARLVDDLLFVARSEAGEPRIAMQAVALPGLVRRCVAETQSMAIEAGVDITVQADRDDLVVQGEAGKLRQVLVILLDNALRYSEKGGAINVWVGPSPGGALLRVADNGIGLAQEEVPMAFERFWRGTRAAERHAHGSGLGLALARSIVEAHGGVISLESRMGEGTSVTVMLPTRPRLGVVA